MATIKERAKKSGIEIAGWNDTLRQGFEVGYELGATEQRKIDVDKAIHAHCSLCATKFGCPYPEPNECYNIRLLRKTMDE